MRRAVTMIGFITAALLTAVPSGLSAQTILDGVRYTLTDGDHYEVTGFDKASAEAAEWGGVLTVVGTVEGLPVTAIAASAFDASYNPDCNSIRQVTLGANIQAIGDYGFFQCSGLTSITMNSALQTVGDNAFKQCTALGSVILPSSMTAVGKAAFSTCTALTSLTIQADGLNIGTSAFTSCTSLREIVFAGTCPTLGMTSFYGVGSDASPTAVLVDKARIGEFFAAMYGAGRYYGWTGGEGKLSLQAYDNGIRYAYVAPDGATPAFYEICGFDAVSIANPGTASQPAYIIQSPATFNGDQVLTIADGAFDKSGSGDVAVIDLRQSGIAGVSVSRSSGAFSGVSAKTVIYMGDGNTSSENNVVIGGSLTATVETVSPAQTYAASEVGSGRAAWMLNDQWGALVFGQRIGTDNVPLPLTDAAPQRVWQVSLIHGGALQYRYANSGGTISLPASADLGFDASDVYHLYIDEDVSKPFTATTAVSSDLQVYGYPKAATLSLDKTALTLRMTDAEAERTVQLAATLLPAEAMQGVSWTTSDASVATVDADGHVKAVGGGQAVITAAALDDGEVKATCTVNVIPKPESVTITPSEIRLVAIGDTQQLSATVYPDGAAQDVVWESSDESIVTVDAQGVVTAKALGKTFVNCYPAANYPTLYSVCRVTVGTNATSLSLSSRNLSLHPGETHTLTVSTRPTDADVKLSWSSSNATVATVSDDGEVKALTVGEADITVCSVDDSSLKAVCHVVVGSSVTAITLSSSALRLRPQETATLSASLSPGDAVTELSWSSSDAQIATVDANGEVKALAAGEADITVASLEDASLKAVCRVTVVPLPESVVLSQTTVRLDAVGDTYSLSATVLPAGASQAVIWESNNEAVAEVSADGVVTAKGLGSTYVNCYPADTYPALLSICRVVVGTPPSAISGTEADGAADRYHDLQGRYVGTSLEHAPRGIYILNGRKVVKRK